MAEIKSLLDDVIEKEIKKLNTLSDGDEKSQAIKDLVQLHKLRIEEIETQIEADEKRERRAMDSRKNDADLALREKQARAQESQQKNELALKTRQADGDDADRKMKDEQHKAEILIKEKQIADAAADRKLKEQQMRAQTEQGNRELNLKEREINSKDADRAREESANQQEIRENRIDRFVKAGTAALELVLPLVCYGIWMGKGFKFEETGTFTSTTFKNLLNRFRPTK